jgi:hypothetical protein
MYQVSFISVVVAQSAAPRTLRLYHLPSGSSRQNSTTIFYKQYSASTDYAEQHFQGMLLNAADVLDAEASSASGGEYITIYVYGIEII